MDSPYARRPRLAGPPRAERLRRERTARELRRIAALELEVRAQVEPALGAAGGPTGEPAMAAWRRDQVTAYRAMPPWARAWRTWRAWGPLRRTLAGLVAAIAWTVLLLPLRSAGMATYRTSEIGFAVLVALAPLLAVLPPGRRGRFVRPIPRRAAPWRGSRQAVLLGRAAAVLAVGGAGVAIAMAASGPGVDEAGLGRKTTALHLAEQRIVAEVIGDACGGPVAVRTEWLGGPRYRARIAGAGPGDAVVVDTRRRRVVGPAPGCPPGP